MPMPKALKNQKAEVSHNPSRMEKSNPPVKSGMIMRKVVVFNLLCAC